MVRAVIPARLIGTYVLYRKSKPVYIGRSDTDLQRRLLRHSSTGRGDYFTYDVHRTSLQAFEVECSLYHALRPDITNVLHPDLPNFGTGVCPFCHDTLASILGNRIQA
jgi:predicted GIY-YIG superfamily endonuclease